MEIKILENFSWNDPNVEITDAKPVPEGYQMAGISSIVTGFIVHEDGTGTIKTESPILPTQQIQSVSGSHLTCN